MAIILPQALRGLSYVALARDAFAAEGVEIRFTSSPHPEAEHEFPGWRRSQEATTGG